MIRKSILELIHDAAHMQRWNDHIRPHQGFTELDKQAHKMIIAYVISKFEESDRKESVDWKKLIEGAFFEFLHRVIITDIKPPIYHKLMKESGDQLNEWVISQLEGKIQGIKGDFFNNCRAYFFEKDYAAVEKRILKAAHYLATNWEFQIIYNLNSGLYGVEQTKTAIENELEEYYDLAGVQKLGQKRKTYNFIDLVGQLRFQKRWAQSPRIPETSVMGHMLIVAMLGYLCSIELNACRKRLANNYFAGLFHDLPEVLTRDIVSPVKRSIEGLDKLIKNIEERQLEDKIFPLVPDSWHRELKYFMEEEFRSKIILDGEIKHVSSDDINRLYNEDRYSPIDGELIKACDNLAAYMEAFLSISHGIKSRHLQDGLKICDKYENKEIAGINFGQIFDYFKASL